MKRCPECRRDYHDDTLSFCLADGSALVYGLSDDEPTTTILRETHLPSVSPTRAQVHTTDGTTMPRSTAASDQGKPGSKPTIAFMGALLAALIAVGLIGYRWYQPSGGGAISSTAVMPFENRSGNTDADYLSDGLTDSLIFRFSQLADLKVSPTSSVMRYKGAAKDAADIAKELEVDAILFGRLTQLGDALTISVQLIDARTKKLIWAEQYDRKMADLMATQREIATMITQKLQLKLSGDEKGITKKYTNNNDAYQLYLKGRYYWARRTKDDLFKAVESYKQAIRLDPNFALAYAAMAEVYNSMAKDPDVAPKDAVPLAKAAATRALELDPKLPKAHSALGDSLAIYDWNWAEAGRELRKALELDGNIAYIHLVYSGSYLGPVGKTEESVAEAERSVELEPLGLINNSVLSSTYFYARRYDKAIAQARHAVDLDANFPLARFWLAAAYTSTGQYDSAIAAVNGTPKDSPAFAMSVAALGQAYARMGKKGEAEQQIAEYREIGKTRYVRRYYIATIYSLMGAKDKAFAELEHCFEEHDAFLNRMNTDPFMDPIRDDPRFKDLLKRVNLTE